VTTSSIARPAPAPPRHAPAGSAPALALRIGAGVDPDRLGVELRRAWRDAGGTRRDATGVALSIVESCGRTPTERERDALRLLDDERRAAGPHGTLRATLVGLRPAEHLLLLALAPGAAAPQALPAIAEALARRYPVATVALG
jgi:hypothetical protein